MSTAADPIAIIGMRGRFPGAEDLDQFWRNLAEGVESITPLSRDDMRAAGIPDHVTSLPGYVNAAPLLGDVDMFDAGFFGFSARDAALTDPQHRLFLETAWEALEDAGYDPAAHKGPIGVFGGCELSTYLYQLHQNLESLGYIDGMQLMVTNDKDHLCTQVSYRLNLRGPSVVVQTTCSTSLVAIGLACESLQAGRCDMALAGGVTVRVPQRGGYFYVAGSILSPDGHCRPFDANAQGTIVGSGVGLVVLKRLEDALADGDGVRAVILGVGINNDGSDKVGYTAPGIRGQAAAIADAYATAGITPDTVGYVEAHGTGTILGDPIELSALTEVFRGHTDRRGFCGIGSVKSNFGHLSCAAGVTGLIKTVLALEHGAIPPTLHYESPNPAIDFASSPFYVTTDLQPWSGNGVPRRAAVSSFGVGGTNAHALLQQAPEQDETAGGRDAVLVTLSARSEAALDETTRRLAEHLDRHPEHDLADAAFTLHVGRRAFRHRRSLALDRNHRDRAVAVLAEPERLGATEVGDAPAVVFLFPGQGAQYPGMAGALYETEPVVRDTVDECCELLEPHLGLDLRRVLFPTADRRAAADAELRDTALAQPALFVVGYALTELWRSWGIRPTAMVGHSVGEFVAATLSGVMRLEDALRLLAVRGRLISSLPPGSMVSVMAPLEEIADVLDDGVALAAVNAPGFSVLSGPTPAIEAVTKALESRSIPARPLHTSHAFHSSMMDPILDEFAATVGAIDLAEPLVPFVSTQTAGWAGVETTQPEYWSAQLRSTVRFEDALRVLADERSVLGTDHVAFVEVGPGRTLTTFADQVSRTVERSWHAMPTLPTADERARELDQALGSLGRLWELGVEVDWTGFHGSERRRRVSLPTYPFERESYWIGAPVRPSDFTPPGPRDVSDWFYVPEWQPAPAAAASEPPGTLVDAPVLVMDDGEGLGDAVADRLRAAGARPFLARRRTGSEPSLDGTDGTFVVDPGDPQSYETMASAVCATGRLAGVVDCWAAGAPGSTSIETGGYTYFLGALRLGHALGTRSTVRPLPIVLAARGTDRVSDDEVLDPARAFSIGAARVLPQEHPGFRVTHADVDEHETVPDDLLRELTTSAPQSQIALRHGQRFLRAYRPEPIADGDDGDDGHALPEHPVVMVTGGLGHMGMALAESLFASFDARLALVGRTAFPDPDRWLEEAEAADRSEHDRDVLRRLAAMRAERDDVFVVAADLRQRDEVFAAVDAACARFGRIDLVIHGAANVGPSAFGPVVETGASVIGNQISPKLHGLELLVAALEGREPARWVLHSSISSVLGGLGLSAYAGANAVLDAIAEQRGPEWLSIGWDAWDNAAEAQMAGVPAAIQPVEGQDVLLRLLRAGIGSQVVVAVGDLEARLESWVRRSEPATSARAGERHPRPNLATPYAEPATATEQALADIWASQLGLERVGVHDRFFDLGGHSLLAVQVASEIRDRFQIEMPVLQLFKAPTVRELAVLVEEAERSGGVIDLVEADIAPSTIETPAAPSRPVEGAVDAPGDAAKASYREFYDDVTRRLAATGMGEASFFLNYGYVSSGPDDDAIREVPEGIPNRNSARLALELVGTTELAGRDALDVGCGRGGTASLLAEQFDAVAAGIDLSPEAIAFCRTAHRGTDARFEVGDAEHIPFDDASFDVVTNLESSHTYPDMRAFLNEVRRVLRAGGWFLHADLLAGPRWMEVRAILAALGLTTVDDRDITANVLASCDEVAMTRTGAFGTRDATIDNFLAIPGSPVYEQMASGAWEYRILRSRLRS